MWGNKSRRIAELEAHVAYLRKALDKSRDTTVQPAKVGPDWQKLAMKYAEDRVADAQAADREMARLQDVAEGWAKLARADERRSLRLARAVFRYWAEVGKLRRAVAERDARIAELEDRLGGDRAIKAAVPRKDPVAAELRTANERIAKLEALVHTLQTANMAQDVRRPALQQAS